MTHKLLYSFNPKEYRLECIDPNSNLIENIMEKVDHTFKSGK